MELATSARQIDVAVRSGDRTEGTVSRGWLSFALFWGLLFGLSLLLRLAHLESRGVWQDEGLTLYQIRLPFLQILENRIPVAHFNTRNTVPPLYFLTLGAWSRLLGSSLWVLRLFSVFSALLASALLYRAGAWMSGRRAGRIAALLGAISPLYLWYAQEIRMYTFLLVPTTLSFALLWRWYQLREAGRSTWRWAVAYAITAAAMGWTHYLAFLLIGPQLLWLTITMLRHRPKVLLLAGVTFLLLAAPLIPYGIERFLYGAERNFAFLSFWTIAEDIFHAFSFGMPFDPRTPYDDLSRLYPLMLLLVGVGLWQARRRGGWPLLLLLGGGFLLPVLLLYLLSYIKPLYQNPRHLMVASPAFFLILALALTRLAEMRRWLAVVTIVVLGYAWVVDTSHFFFDDRAYFKADVQPLFEYIVANYVPGDVVALNEPVLQHAFEYFAPDIPWIILPPYGAHPTDEGLDYVYGQVAQQWDRVWYVYGPPDASHDTWRHVYDWFFARYARLDYIEFPGPMVIGAARFDTQGPLVQETPHEAAIPFDARFAGSIRFVGLDAPLAAIPAGEPGVVETLWAVDAQPSKDMEMVLRVTDGAGQVWFQSQAAPLRGLHATSHWVAGQHVRVPLFIHLPTHLPPATYRLELYLADMTGAPIFPEGSGAPLSLGALTVEPAREGGKVEGPEIASSLQVAVAPLPERLPAAPAITLQVRARIKDLSTLPERWVVQVESTDGELAWELSVPFEQGLPLGEDGNPQAPRGGWQPGSVLGLRYPLQLPPSLAGTYRLFLQPYGAEGALPVKRWWGLLRSDRLALGSVTIEERAVRVEAPPLDERVDREWPGIVRLLGYSAAPVETEGAQPGATSLTLAWEAMAAPERPYKVFIHALDEGGAFVAGADAFFDVPAVAWQEGEIVLSEHRFDALPPGRYTLVVGLYHEASGERLPVDAPDNALPFGTLFIGEQ